MSKLALSVIVAVILGIAGGMAIGSVWWNVVSQVATPSGGAEQGNGDGAGHNAVADLDRTFASADLESFLISNDEASAIYGAPTADRRDDTGDTFPHHVYPTCTDPDGCGIGIPPCDQLQLHTMTGVPHPESVYINGYDSSLGYAYSVEHSVLRFANVTDASTWFNSYATSADECVNYGGDEYLSATSTTVDGLTVLAGRVPVWPPNVPHAGAALNVYPHTIYAIVQRANVVSFVSVYDDANRLTDSARDQARDAVAAAALAAVPSGA